MSSLCWSVGRRPATVFLSRSVAQELTCLISRCRTRVAVEGTDCVPTAVVSSAVIYVAYRHRPSDFCRKRISWVLQPLFGWFLLFDEDRVALSTATGRVVSIGSGFFDCFSRFLAGSCFSTRIVPPFRLPLAGWFLPKADFLVPSAAFWLVLVFDDGSVGLSTTTDRAASIGRGFLR